LDAKLVKKRNDNIFANKNRSISVLLLLVLSPQFMVFGEKMRWLP